MVPRSPTAHTKSSVPPTASNVLDPGVACRCQPAPSKCTIEPLVPTAQTELPSSPQTERRTSLPPTDESIQLEPSQCKHVPRSPTAHTSSGPAPQTSVKAGTLGVGSMLHALPFQRRIVASKMIAPWANE